MAKHKTVAAVKPLDLALRPGQSIELLKELHILTRDGKLNQDSRRKLKQVYHLYQFIEKLLNDLQAKGYAKPEFGPTLADHGAGKSYLGFIIYDLYFKALGQGAIYGIETRSELVASSQALAQRLGFDRMRFLNLSVAESASSDALPMQIDVVTALHACDTATDDAIAFGLQKKTKCMVLVPCCQAELARALNQNKALNLQRPPFAHARNGQSTHQCVALPLPRVARLPSDRDRVGRLGAQHEKRTHPRDLHRPKETQRHRTP